MTEVTFVSQQTTSPAELGARQHQPLSLCSVKPSFHLLNGCGLVEQQVAHQALQHLGRREFAVGFRFDLLRICCTARSTTSRTTSCATNRTNGIPAVEVDANSLKFF